VRVRAVLGSVFASAAILAIGWQFGSATAASLQGADAGPASTPTPGPSSTPGSPSTPGSSPIPAPGTSSAPSPSPSAPQSGTFTGAVESTRYGNVQVQITVANGAITDVKALQLTDDGGRSVQISNRAAPILRSEVLKAQSALVSSVSGATYTTDGYLSSLQSALDKAGL